MGTLSADAIRRIYLLYVLGRFQKGAFGGKRLQKIAYLSEREGANRPFQFISYHYGEYSEQLEDIKEQLLTMDYVSAWPLDSVHVDEFGTESTGNRFVLTSRADMALYHKVLSAWSPGLPARIDQVIANYGYKPEQDLIDYCYSLPEFRQTPFGELVLDSDIDVLVDVQLSDDECQDLELAMNPYFIDAMLRLTDALDETEIDWGNVRQGDLHASAS